MTRIRIDATAPIHGEPAVRKKCPNLLRHVVSLPGGDRRVLPSLGRGAESLDRLAWMVGTYPDRGSEDASGPPHAACFGSDFEVRHRQGHRS